jgi:hypothetical protein
MVISLVKNQLVTCDNYGECREGGESGECAGKKLGECREKIRRVQGKN